MEDVNLKTVQELMEHKTIAMTARYAHLAPGYLASGLETFCPAQEPGGEKGERGGKKQPVLGGPELVPGAFSDPSCSSHIVENKR